MKFVNRCILLITAAVACSAQYKEKAIPDKYTIINSYSRPGHYSDDVDPGEALFLTPLIRNDSLPRKQVQDLARVSGDQFLGVESFSGYLTVDKTYNSNLFFWYFPAEQNPERAPVVLWLQGGPGCSSLLGLFLEIGPFQITAQNRLKKRKYSWSTTHNVIFIDNPVGTGFSFTDHEQGYARNERDVGSNLYEAMKQLYKLFEWKKTSHFWITGESYAGKYVPALAYYIHKAQQEQQEQLCDRIPLRGLAIGNGLSDPVHQLMYGDYLYQLGLIDDQGLKQFHTAEASVVACIESNNLRCAAEIFDTLILGNSPKGSLFKNLTGYDWYYNYLQTVDDDFVAPLGNFLESGTIRRAIHVGRQAFHDMDKINKVKIFLTEDLMDSVAPWIEELLEFYQVCFYSGQLDVIVSYPQTRNFLKHLNFSGSQLYKTAPRKIWRVDGQLAGYVKQAGNLIEVFVRNAGHLAPSDQPKWVYDMIHHMTHKY